MEKITPALLQLQQVCRSYGSRQVLRGVELQLQQGQSLAVMGKSGCGKTTLLNILGGLDRQDRGTLLFRGEELKQSMLRQYRREHVGFLFQSSGLIEEFTALENVKAAVTISKSGAEPMEYLRFVGMEEYAHAYPRQLSGGQGHRVALARAFAKKPTVLLLDEPTAGLDLQTGRQIMDLTQALCRERGITLVMVTHEREFAARMDRCVLLRQGVLVEGAAL